MTFDVDPDRIFLVERHAEGMSEPAVKSVEFVIMGRQENSILLVEAKTSAPNPKGSKEENFDDFCKEICQKAVDSFSLFMNAVLGRPSPSRLPETPGRDLLAIDLAKATFSLVLIIRKHRQEWLEPIKNRLNNDLRHFITLWRWGHHPVIVLNEEWARKRGLVL